MKAASRSERLLRFLHRAMSSELRAETFTSGLRARARSADRMACPYQEAHRVEGQRAALVLHKLLTSSVAAPYTRGTL